MFGQIDRCLRNAENTVEDCNQFMKQDGFFPVRKNVIFERARFNHLNQCEGESKEEYITCLYNFVDNCQYRDLKSEIISHWLGSKEGSCGRGGAGYRSGKVVAPKQNSTIRICMDLKPLDTHALHETYPLPKVDDVLA